MRMNHMQYPAKVQRWDVFELTVSGPKEGNPFAGQCIEATFACAGERVRVTGFYDGDGVYRVRFMPAFVGAYTFEVESSFGAAGTGAFEATEPDADNHGMVRAANTWHFAYDDGTPYYSVGTTCYVWAWQSDALIEKTLDTLEHSAFNKIRFCVFPKHYDYNLNEPRSYPYEGTPVDSSALTPENFWQYTGRTEGNCWDFARFNPAHFQHLDWCIERLRAMGIQADLILFHPYDRWGFSQMTREQDEFYIRYMMARYAAYRNVWWSLANEYDLMKKTLADWEHIAQIICENDPYHHLRSIHNCGPFYDHHRPWVTHCSIQRQDNYKTAEYADVWREQYRKPVVIDEMCYEGNIQHGWGNITGEEMVRRFWEAAVRGGYPGHGETYLHPGNVLWWSHGGELHGESHKRFAFLLDVMKQTPGLGLKRSGSGSWDEVCAEPEERRFAGSYYLHYYGFMRPSFRDFAMADDAQYDVFVLDTWNMTRTHAGRFSGRFRINLPGRPYMAVQVIRAQQH